MPPVRLGGASSLSWLTRAASGYWRLFDSQCGYTVASRHALAAIGPERMFARYGYPNDLLARLGAAGARVVDVPVRPVYGPAWRSGLRPSRVALPIAWLLLRAFVRRVVVSRVALAAPARATCGAARSARRSRANRPPDHLVPAPRGRLRRQLRRRSRCSGCSTKGTRSRCWPRRGGDGPCDGRRSRSPCGASRRRRRSFTARGRPRRSSAAARSGWRRRSSRLRWRRRRARRRALGRDRIALARPLGAGGVRGGADAARAAPTRTRATSRCSNGSRSVAPLRAGSRATEPTCASSAPISRLGSRGSAASTGDARHGRAARRPARAVLASRGPDAALRRRFGLAAPTVLAVGRLVPIKGHAALLHACARARARRRPRRQPEVVILGDGPERRASPGSRPRSRFRSGSPGSVPRAEVADWLRAADLFAQPSLRLPNGRTEGAPIAAREAHAVGIPVVVDGDVAVLARAIGAIGDAVTGSSTACNGIRTSEARPAKPGSHLRPFRRSKILKSQQPPGRHVPCSIGDHRCEVPPCRNACPSSPS